MHLVTSIHWYHDILMYQCQLSQYCIITDSTLSWCIAILKLGKVDLQFIITAHMTSEESSYNFIFHYLSCDLIMHQMSNSYGKLLHCSFAEV